LTNLLDHLVPHAISARPAGDQSHDSAGHIAEVKAKLSLLLNRALAGEEVVTARAGKPLAWLTPVGGPAARKRGAWRGLKIPSDALLAPMDPEDLDAAEGAHTDEFGIMLPREPRDYCSIRTSCCGG
jgi:antitoxin (DNA-binding transcriptional repressor) of toxin-antitoxin stability system